MSKRNRDMAVHFRYTLRDLFLKQIHTNSQPSDGWNSALKLLSLIWDSLVFDMKSTLKNMA